MRKIRHTLRAAMLVFTIMLGTMPNHTMLAQVSIKERIAIQPRVPWVTNGTQSSGSGPVFIAPKRTAFMIMPMNLYKMYTPPSPSSFLRVTTRDTTYHFPFVAALPCLYPVVNLDSSVCQHQWIYDTTYNRNCWTCPEGTGFPIDSFYTRTVNAGDTLQFAYIGSDTSFVTQIWYNPSPGDTNWQIDFKAPPLDSCYKVPKIREYGEFFLFYADTTFAGFKVSTDIDSVSVLDTAKITVIAIRHDSSEVSISGNTLLTFTLDSTRLGTFIDTLGHPLSSPLSNVKYSDARAGKIRFAPNIIPDTTSFKSVMVRVDGASMTGFKQITVGKIKLRFVDKTPRRIWPYIDRADKGANRAGYKSSRAFAVKVNSPTGKPIKSHLLTARTSFISYSGGHLHTTSKDTTPHPPSLQGSFWTMNHPHNPLTGLTTDLNGSAVIDSFRAAPFSGKYIVTVNLGSDTTVFDSVLLYVRALADTSDTLVEFGTGDYWTLSGATSDTGKNHPSNHWCTQKMKDSLSAALKDFYDWSSLPSAYGYSVKLGVNDMSITWGGCFDIGGLWDQSVHEYHRVGLSVDIDNYQYGLRIPRKDHPKIKDWTPKGTELKACMLKYGGKPYDEPKIHFGFDKGI